MRVIINEDYWRQKTETEAYCISRDTHTVDFTENELQNYIDAYCTPENSAIYYSCYHNALEITIAHYVK